MGVHRFIAGWGRPGPAAGVGRALWRLALVGGLVGLGSFFVFGGLVTVALGSYGRWQGGMGPLEAIATGVAGAVVLGPRLAVERWYLSAPLGLLVLRAALALRRPRGSGRVRDGEGASPPPAP